VCIVASWHPAYANAFAGLGAATLRRELIEMATLLIDAQVPKGDVRSK
jgi:hypothetical protein